MRQPDWSQGKRAPSADVLLFRKRTAACGTNRRRPFLRHLGVQICIPDLCAREKTLGRRFVFVVIVRGNPLGATVTFARFDFQRTGRHLFRSTSRRKNVIFEGFSIFVLSDRFIVLRVMKGVAGWESWFFVSISRFFCF